MLAGEGPDRLREGGVFVFDSMGFVNDDVLPLVFLERTLLFNNHLVRSHANLKFPRHKDVVPAAKCKADVTELAPMQTRVPTGCRREGRIT